VTEIAPPNAPSPEELERELQQVRAAQPEVMVSAEPTVGKLLVKTASRVVALWVVLILVFLAVCWLLGPSH
jgi:hypothetical protein